LLGLTLEHNLLRPGTSFTLPKIRSKSYGPPPSVQPNLSIKALGVNEVSQVDQLSQEQLANVGREAVSLYLAAAENARMRQEAAVAKHTAQDKLIGLAEILLGKEATIIVLDEGDIPITFIHLGLRLPRSASKAYPRQITAKLFYEALRPDLYDGQPDILKLERDGVFRPGYWEVALFDYDSGLPRVSIAVS